MMMKSKNWPNYLIGLSVILCSLALLGAMSYALSGSAWHKGGRTVQIDFHDATGIKPHSDVRYAGKSAGSVSEIRYLTAAERAKAKDKLNLLRVTVQLGTDVPPLPEDVTAKLDAETLLGEKFIALAPGSADAKPLPDGRIVQGADPSSIDGLLRSGHTALESLGDILDSLKADYPTLIPRLAELLSNGNSILRQGSNLVYNADSTVVNANEAVTNLKKDLAEFMSRLNSLAVQGKTVVTNADIALVRVTTVLDRLDGVVKTNEGDLAKILAELRVVSQNLKVISTYGKSLTATLAEKPSRLIWGGKTNEIPSERQILENPEPVPGRKPKK